MYDLRAAQQPLLLAAGCGSSRQPDMGCAYCTPALCDACRRLADLLPLLGMLRQHRACCGCAAHAAKSVAVFLFWVQHAHRFCVRTHAIFGMASCCKGQHLPLFQFNSGTALVLKRLACMQHMLLGVSFVLFCVL